jgi:hypothetical protein
MMARAPAPWILVVAAALVLLARAPSPADARVIHRRGGARPSSPDAFASAAAAAAAKAQQDREDDKLLPEALPSPSPRAVDDPEIVEAANVSVTAGPGDVEWPGPVSPHLTPTFPPPSTPLVQPQWAINHLRGMSDSGIYESLKLERIVEASSAVRTPFVRTPLFTVLSPLTQSNPPTLSLSPTPRRRASSTTTPSSPSSCPPRTSSTASRRRRTR